MTFQRDARLVEGLQLALSRVGPTPSVDLASMPERDRVAFLESSKRLRDLFWRYRDHLDALQRRLFTTEEWCDLVALKDSVPFHVRHFRGYSWEMFCLLNSPIPVLINLGGGFGFTGLPEPDAWTDLDAILQYMAHRLDEESAAAREASESDPDISRVLEVLLSSAWSLKLIRVLKKLDEGPCSSRVLAERCKNKASYIERRLSSVLTKLKLWEKAGKEGYWVIRRISELGREVLKANASHKKG